MNEPAKADRYPRQTFYIVGNEAAERFSFYGMTSILFIYMSQDLGFGDALATARYHFFTAAVYYMPLLGGFLADRFFGRYRIILWVSFLYLAGHATLAAWDGPWGLLAGCALIAVGAGGIKPCVSAFVGDQFTKEQQGLLERAYGWFYFAINVGALIGQPLIPFLKDLYKPDKSGHAPLTQHQAVQLAFGVPGIAMALALLIYVAGRHLYVKAPPTGPNPNGFLRVLFGSRFDLKAAEQKFPLEVVNGVRAALRVAAVFVPCIVFWSLFYQYGSSWVGQAEAMDRSFPGFDNPIPSSSISTLNGLFVLMLIPIMNRLYTALEKRGRNVTPLRKMAIGMFITPFAFVAAAIIQIWIGKGYHPHVSWQIIQYFLISLGEVLVSVTALEFAYTQAPPSMKSVIMGLWFVTIGTGTLLTGVIAELNVFSGATFYWFFTGLQLVAAVAFTAVAAWYKPALKETMV